MDWDRIALQSEIEYSKAYGGEPTQYESFVHIHNPAVPFAGDFNRAVGVRVSDPASFHQVVRRVGSIHNEKGLDRPDRYDIRPPVLSEGVWARHLFERGYRLGTAVFFSATTAGAHAPPGVELYSPRANEYIDWYHDLQKTASYYDEEWFQKIRPLQLRFIRTFRPYWLLEGEKLRGYVYCAAVGEWCRLFAVEIEEGSRGRGLGKALLDAIRVEAASEGASFVLLQSGDTLRGFYEKAGFCECSRNSIIRLK